MEEDKADKGRGGKTTSGNGQAWSSASPRGQWGTGKNGENWLQDICGAPTTLGVKELMMMMIMMMMMMISLPFQFVQLLFLPSPLQTCSVKKDESGFGLWLDSCFAPTCPSGLAGL